MNKKDTSLMLSIMLLITVLISTATATFAYFTATNTDKVNSFELNASTMGHAYSEAGSNIDLIVSGEVMSSTQSSETIPAATASNDMPIKITLRTTDNGGTLNCEYDLVYEPETPFYHSALNVTNAKEFTLQGSSNRGNTLLEYDLENITEKVTLNSEKLKISLEGVNKTLVEEWTLTVNFYNQPFNQDDNTFKKFGGQVLIENLECENIFN